MKLNKTLVFLFIFYLPIVIWWFIIFFSGSKTGDANFQFVFIYGLIPIVGGILGIVKARHWGLFKSAIGKGLFFLSLGLITWGGGETIWSYYNLVEQIEIPYPSWADASFLASWPFWSIGVFYLSKATGAKYGLKDKKGKFYLLLIPVVVIFLSYYLLIIVARDGVITDGGDLLKVFFDLAYPIWDAIIVSLTLTVYGLSFKYLGGRFRLPVLIIFFGFIVNYIADFSFSYTTTVGTYFNASWPDLLFATVMFVLAYGVNSFDAKGK